MTTVSQDPAARDVGRLLLESLSRLTEGQRKVADVLLNSPASGALLTSAELAKAAEVSDATVIRLSQQLGFSSYIDFRRACRHQIRQHLDPAGRLQDTRQSVDGHDGLSATLSIAKQSLESLDLDELSPQIASAAEKIVNSRTLYVTGARSTFHLAHMATGIFDHFLPNVRILGGDSNPTPAHHFIGADDVLLAISFPRYAISTTQLASFARHRGASVIALTDSPSSPVAGSADLILKVPCVSASFYNSHTAATVAIEALIAECVKRKGDEALDALSVREDSLNLINHLVERTHFSAGAGEAPH